MSASSRSQPADFLREMSRRSAARVDAARSRCRLDELAARARDRDAPPALRLRAGAFDLIAEVKRRSPALGSLADEELDPVAQARRYADAGAAALSVLTEPDEFQGSLDDLERVSAEVGLRPAMRKDFLVDPYQVWEARAAGAGGVLLVAASLTPERLEEMLVLTLELGMFALVELFAEADLEQALPILDGARPEASARVLVGVNCRDLRTLRVDFRRFAKLAPSLPAGLPRVAESGIATPADAASVAGLGYDLALVGTALMKAGDPAGAASALLQAGRAAR